MECEADASKSLETADGTCSRWQGPPRALSLPVLAGTLSAGGPFSQARAAVTRPQSASLNAKQNCSSFLFFKEKYTGMEHIQH